MGKKSSLIENPTVTKIIAFCLALILWFFVSGDRQGLEYQVYEMRRSFENIPLGLRNLGDDLVVTEMTGEVTIVLQGLQTAFDGLTPADLEVYIDLSGKKTGRHEMLINAVAPPGMSVVRIDPSRTTVTLEELIALQLPVEAELHGENASGMIVDSIFFEPQQIFIQGSRRNVEQTTRVVFYLDIETSDVVLRRNVRLYPLNSLGDLVVDVSISPEYVDVEANFVFPVKEVPIEPVLRESGSETENIEIYPSVITVQGPQDLIREITTILTEEIDPRKWENGAAEDVPLIFPPGITSPYDIETVRVWITFAETIN